jgi:hypothetical protein
MGSPMLSFKTDRSGVSLICLGCKLLIERRFASIDFLLRVLLTAEHGGSFHRY